MNMMGMGMGGDSSDVANLPLNDPRCIAAGDECLAFWAAGNASQAAVPWAGQFEYGHWLAYYYACIIFIFTIIALKQRLFAALQPRRTQGFVWKQRLTASYRWISYRRPSSWLYRSIGAPSLGVLALLLASTVVILLLTFTSRPYYRQYEGYGSPPLAIRSGLMASALIPLLIALGGKVNLVTMLTGISHERLNIWHRWAGYACFGLSAVHAIPFIVQPLREGGTANLHAQFYETTTGACQFTGIAPFAMLFGLVTLSIPWVRRRVYEAFYFVHIILAILFVVLCFWHFDNTMDSWCYLWATLGIWGLSWLARVFTKNSAISYGRAFPTTVSVISDKLMALDIFVPRSLTWHPGQHVFLRCQALGSMHNHPFTIASVSEECGKEDYHTIRLLVRTRSGFTRTFAQRMLQDADWSPRVTVDGPYGTTLPGVSKDYDHALLVAGGSGISFLLPWLKHLILSADNTIKTVKLVWAVADVRELDALHEDLQQVTRASQSRGLRLQLDVYMTRSAKAVDTCCAVRDQEDVVGSKALEEITALSTSSGMNTPVDEKRYRLPITEHSGRPLLNELVPSLLDEPGRWTVLGCGPETFKIDLCNAVAAAQKKVIRNEIEELALHTETFGW